MTADMFIIGPDDVVREPGEDPVSTAERMIIVLMHHPWAELRSRTDPDHVSRWTVMERGPGGCPVHVTIESPDGTVSFVNNARRP